MSEHLSPADLEQVIDDALDASSRGRVHSHLRLCEACARRLQKSAQLEMALYEVAAGRPRRSGRVAIAAAIGLATAASVLLGVRAPSAGELTGQSIPRCAETADASTDAASCTAMASPVDGLLHGDD